jgi:hypothetical protein
MDIAEALQRNLHLFDGIINILGNIREISDFGIALLVRRQLGIFVILYPEMGLIKIPAVVGFIGDNQGVCITVSVLILNPGTDKANIRILACYERLTFQFVGADLRGKFIKRQQRLGEFDINTFVNSNRIARPRNLSNSKKLSGFDSHHTCPGHSCKVSFKNKGVITEVSSVHRYVPFGPVVITQTFIVSRCCRISRVCPNSIRFIRKGNIKMTQFGIAVYSDPVCKGCVNTVINRLL